MIRIFTSRLLIYMILTLLSIGLAVSFVMAKDEDPKSVEVKNSPSPKSEPSPKVEASPKSGTGKDSQADVKQKPVNCVASEAAVEDVRRAQEEIEKKQKELAAKEAELKIRESAISEELKKLTSDREAIQKVQLEQSKEAEEKRAKLIETLLAMSPKAAAKVISSIDDALAVSVMFQMDTPRLAKILNLIDPKRSTQLSEKLVGLARTKDASPDRVERSVSSDTAEANDKKLRKGGEK